MKVVFAERVISLMEENWLEGRVAEVGARGLAISKP